MNTEMRLADLQYQLSNGNWIDCGERTDEFLSRIAVNNGPDETGKIVPRFRAIRDLTTREATAVLETGRELRNHPDDWYSNCRIKPEPRPVQEVEMIKCSCGHSVPRVQVMSASMGTSCPDCYDRMSE